MSVFRKNTLKKNTEFTECNECFWEGYQNRNHLSICHSEYREESENSYFMYTDPSLRSG